MSEVSEVSEVPVKYMRLFNTLEGLADLAETLCDADEGLERTRDDIVTLTHCKVSTHEQDGYLMNYDIHKWATSRVPKSKIAKIEDYAHPEIVVLRDNIDEPMPVNVPTNTFKRVVTLTNGRRLFCL